MNWIEWSGSILTPVYSTQRDCAITKRLNLETLLLNNRPELHHLVGRSERAAQSTTPSFAHHFCHIPYLIIHFRPPPWGSPKSPYGTVWFACIHISRKTLRNLARQEIHVFIFVNCSFTDFSDIHSVYVLAKYIRMSITHIICTEVEILTLCNILSRLLAKSIKMLAELAIGRWSPYSCSREAIILYTCTFSCWIDD